MGMYISSQVVPKLQPYKYDPSLQSHYLKPINGILMGFQSNRITPFTIHYQDILALCNDYESMRRMYPAKADDGRDEMKDRIRFLGKLYDRVFIMKFEYPMMIVTRNESTFFRRLREMKALQEDHLSFHESEVEDSGEILQNLSADSISSSQFSQCRAHRQLEAITFIHKSQYPDHLICEINDVDEKQFYEQYAYLKEKKRVGEIVMNENKHQNQAKNSRSEAIANQQNVSLSSDDFPWFYQGNCPDGSEQNRQMILQKEDSAFKYEIYLSRKQKLLERAALLLHRTKMRKLNDILLYS